MLDIVKRIKYIEEKLDALNQKVYAFERDYQRDLNEINEKLNKVNEELSFLKKELNELRKRIDALIIRLKFFATKDEVKMIQRYLEYFTPLGFVTENELKRVLEKYVTKEELNKIIKEIKQIINNASVVQEEEE